MKKAINLIVMLVVIISLSACGGSNTDKQKLCEGFWVKKSEYLMRNKTAYDYTVYSFSEDGTFTQAYYYFYITFDQDNYSGNYKIDTKNHQITLTYSPNPQGYKPETISYYINEYNHNLVLSPKNNGESDYKNYYSLDNIYVPDFGSLSKYLK